MKRDPIEDRLEQAVRRTAPDRLAEILQECEGEKMLRFRFPIERVEKTQAEQIPAGQNQEPAALAAPLAGKTLDQKNKTRRWAASITAAAAALVLVVSGTLAYQTLFHVDSVIGIDVNPSIELKTNRSEKVLSAEALNPDAETILGGMDLRNVDLEVAVNAVIGSMLKNGFLDNDTNSVLITVENDDAQKGEDLQRRLAQEVGDILSQNALEGAIVSQTLAAGQESSLRALAEEYGISLGKAAFVQQLVDQDATLSFAELAALPINDLNLLAESKGVQMESAISTGHANAESYIAADAAAQAAYAHAGVSAAEVDRSWTEMDFDGGRMVYEVEFDVGSTEYDYEIDAATGEVVKSGAEQNRPASGGSTGNSSASGDIGEAAAKAAALAHAGLSEGEVSFVHTERDYDDGRLVYEIEFYANNTEYDYEIDAATGGIVQFDHDAEYYAPPASQPASSGSSGDIGEAAANAAALAHAGLSEGDANYIHVERDYDDGRLVYELEFRSGRMEYECEVDAATGSILQFESDYDD